MFENMPLWKRVDSSDGHAAFEHTVTHIHVGFQRHGKNSEVPASQAVDIMNNLQEHINTLGNDIFRYDTRNWKTVPDFEASVRNYQVWLKQRSARTAAA